MNDIISLFLLPVSVFHHADSLPEKIMTLGVALFCYFIFLLAIIYGSKGVFYLANCVGIKNHEGSAKILKKIHFEADDTRMDNLLSNGGTLPITMEGTYCPDYWALEVEVEGRVKEYAVTQAQFNSVIIGQDIKAFYRSGRIKKCVDLKHLQFIN